MSKFLERFYLVSKLSTIFLLLGIIFFLFFLFWESYNKIDTSNNISNFDENLDIIVGHLEKNTEEIKKLNIQIDESKNQNQAINKFLNNQKNSNNLIEENKILKDEIKKLSIEMEKLNNKISTKQNKKTNDNINGNNIVLDKNLINLIKMKFENGSDVYNELKLLNKIINDESDIAYLEKLFVLSDQKFKGVQYLKIEYKKLVQEYMNIHYLKNNDNFFIRSISNFIVIEPNNESNIKNQDIKILSIIEEKVEQQDIKDAIFYLNKIDQDNFFKSWVDQAGLYLDFCVNLEKIFN